MWIAVVYGTIENNNSHSLPLRMFFFLSNTRCCCWECHCGKRYCKTKEQKFQYFKIFWCVCGPFGLTGIHWARSYDTFQPHEKCVIKGLLPLTNYRIRLRACDQSSRCSGYKAGEGFRTLGDGKSFYRYDTCQNQCATHDQQHVGPLR